MAMLNTCMAIKSNLIIDQGSDFATNIVIRDENDQVLNITGYAANGSIRKTYSSSNTVLFNTSISGNSGIVTISLPASATANIAAGRYVFDVIVTDTLSRKKRVVEGIMTVTPAVTR